MIKIYLSLILLFLSLFAVAQKTVSGKVVDEKSQTIPFASVTILRQADSVKAHTAITDTAGNFSMPGVGTGNYLVKISYIGYKDYYTAVIALNQNQQPYHLGEIRLKADSRALNMVTISVQRPVIEQTLDRTIMNIEKSVLAEGNTAMELLSKAPGVTLSESGEVALKGRSGTAVMINGKPTYLSSDQLANLLRGTSSSAISRIEIMANPPAKYDAAGSGGIVNIILKKNTLSGFNGVATGTIGSGRGLRYGEGLSLNYRGGHVNLFGSYNANNQDIKTSSATERQFYAGNSGPVNTAIRGVYLQSIFQDISEEAKLRSHNFRAGADINLNDHHTIGFLLNGAIGKYPTIQPGASRVIRNDGTLLLNAPTLTKNEENWEDLLYNLNYVLRFKKEGHELKADLDYVSHFSRMEQQLDTRYLDAIGNNLSTSSGRRGNIPSYNDIYAGKVDYSLPLTKKSKLEAGWKGSEVRTENNLQYDTLQIGQYVADASASNHFIYKEKIQAAYINFNTSFDQFSLQAGLRAEYTRTKGRQVTTDSAFKRNYSGIFPSLYLTRDIDEKHQLKTGYSRRIKRPGYWDLNPFRVYDDPFTYYEGNPYLKPAIVNALELSYSYQSRYFTTLSYNHTGNVIGAKIGQTGNVVYQRPDNLGSFTNFGISFTAATNLFKWWSGSQFLNLYHNRYIISNNPGDFVNKANTLSFNSQHSFAIGDGWKGELTGFYTTKEIDGTVTTKAYSMISAGVQKEILRQKGNLKLMANDIFRGYQIRQTTSYGNIITYSRRNADSRYVQLSFSYKFGSSNNANVERKTGSEDLKDRIK